MVGQNRTQAIGDDGGDASALVMRCRGDQSDPAEAALLVGDAAAGADNVAPFLDDDEAIGLGRHEPLDAVRERRRAIGVLHHHVHRIERGRLRRRVDSSRRHVDRSYWSVFRPPGCHLALHNAGAECFAPTGVPRSTPPGTPERGTARDGARAVRTFSGHAAGNYLTSTVAPASASLVLAASAASLVAFSRTGLGAPSTRSLASFRPRLVSSRTTLMTWIFCAPASVRMTSNSSFSSSTGAAAAPPPPASATATGAAAVTPNFSSNASSSSLSSITVIPEMASRTSSLVSVAMVVFSLRKCVVRNWLLRCRRATYAAASVTLGRLPTQPPSDR